jgi:hypothetical protein
MVQQSTGVRLRMVGSYVSRMTVAYQNHADGCQKELHHPTLLVAPNSTTRSMLHHHVLFMFTGLCFASNGVIVLVTNCSEDVKITVVYSLRENSARVIL